MNVDFKAKFNELKDKLGKRNKIIAPSIIAVLLIILTVCLVGCNTGENTYTITYELNGGTISESAPKSYTTEKGDVVIVNPTKDGYTFLGWTTDSITTPTKDLVIKQGENMGNLNLKANWELANYTITYNLDGGVNNTNNPSTYTMLSEDITIAAPSKVGYRFIGWTSATVTTPTLTLVITKGKTGDLTLTANWQVYYYSYTDDTKTSVYFGSYPQTKVTDDTLIATLNEKAGTLPTSSNLYKWTDYGYYISGSVSSFMYYIDIDNDSDGVNDYRGVYFTQYRPYNTDTTVGNTNQEDNGYNTNTTYWFKYEKVKWNILKTENGKALIVSDLILDSQDYYYSASSRSGATDYQGNPTTDTVNANNYMYSHIRSWLNETFYETAFSTLEKEIIETTTVDNSASSTGDSSNSYACSNTSDKLFLLSYEEATTYYSSDSERQAKGTDYAKSQGLCIISGYSWYWLRSPENSDGTEAKDVAFDGIGDYADYVLDADGGVRAACWINL